MRAHLTHVGYRYTPYDFLGYVDHVFFEDKFFGFPSILHRCGILQVCNPSMPFIDVSRSIGLVFFVLSQYTVVISFSSTYRRSKEARGKIWKREMINDF